ncbi:hypothetical protein BV22DRAFT_1108497 [Leucogyrophana mollusca]|uniref:Uncharacterized protein n=1 Tax=Leucogyrophana mollusca TaxID=85980 RepID=A0ACB8AWQ3_9AGAM|nr:hypothetical protein BV22DRAFT_1108497 [Leucogyrophana mollusca]
MQLPPHAPPTQAIVLTDADVIRFKRMKGFKIHKRKVSDTDTPSGQHTKVRSDPIGNIRLTTKTYTIPKSTSAPSQSQQQTVDSSTHSHHPEIPECVDNLPPEVDLGVLDLPRRRRTASHDRSTFLHELIWLEGRCGSPDVCSDCEVAQAKYRCDDCFGVDMCCSSCMLARHRLNPLHRVKEWTGAYFERRSLRDLGLRVQLGHPVGKTCYRPKSAPGDDFVVIHHNGIHSVGVSYCGCDSDKPKTAATFSLLEEFHLLSLESKVSAYEYYQSLARRSCNTGMTLVKDRYEQFLRVMREWQHLKMLKRAGRGHDPMGPEGTQEGGCAVLCPACPHPGKNLPSDWETAPRIQRWLYALFVAIDANFRLKRKLVSKDAVDPSLSQGWSFFVAESPYKVFLKDHIDEPQEKSTCSSHNAVDMADTKSSRGLAATGVGTVDCACHNMKLACGVGDLQKGEKYVNMDYLFFSALRGTSLKVLNVSYDIACQWHKHLWQRMGSLPFSQHLNHADKDITFLVPKFHLPAHIAPCQWLYSFNWTRGVGRTDGEAPERGWANINPVASSTKEMGPGHRRDTIDDHFSDWNWKKVVGLGPTLLRKIAEAIPERNEHQDDLHELEGSLETKYPELLAKWRREIEEWEEDSTRPNPFEVKVQTVTQASIRLQLAKDDAKDASEAEQPPLHADISPSVLIAAGTDLEEQQRRLRLDRSNLGQHATDDQKQKAWTKVQSLYVPGVVALRERSSGNLSTTKDAEKPEDYPLWLPSQIQRKVLCTPHLEDIEWQLRFAQAHDALNELRQSLRSRSYMLRFKDRFLRGQGANTRARNFALLALGTLGPLLGKVGWKNALRPLENDDIRPMTQDVDAPTSEGRRRLSWIWLTIGYSEGLDEEADEGLQDAIRLEWCKARARAMRWTEEVELLFEEKRRVLQFMDWQSRWWLERAGSVVVEESTLAEGLQAYAQRQAALRRSLGDYFAHVWRDTQSLLDIANVRELS